jgi:hypothetical protein
MQTGYRGSRGSAAAGVGSAVIAASINAAPSRLNIHLQILETFTLSRSNTAQPKLPAF